MLSSTSSSNTRIPEAPYGRLSFVTVALFLVTLAFFEWFWRREGHLPSVADTARFWGIHRADVYETDGQKRLIIVGSSRARTNLWPRMVGAVLPEFRVKHLAVAGQNGFAILDDICQDPGFRSVVLWDIHESALTDLGLGKGDDGADSVYASLFNDDFSGPRSWDKNINCWIGANLQRIMVTMAPHLTARALLRAGGRPKRNRASMCYDRFGPDRIRAVFTMSELADYRRRRAERFRFRGVRDLKAFESQLATSVRTMNERLTMKGGYLILVRMPTSGEQWAFDSLSAPKERFWDRAQTLSGAPTIHFRDYPELSEFDCPDMSHLDASDAPEFTRRLALILRRKLEEDGILPATKPPTRRVGQSAFAAPATAPR